MKTDAMLDILFDKRRQEHLEKTRELFNSYMRKPKLLKTNLLMSFSAWPEVCKHKEGIFSLTEHQALFDAKNSALQEGGYFLSLQQKGICINPSGTFFEELCQKGYSLQDIDVVFATANLPSIQETIKCLHSLNRECNRTLVSYGQEPHVIRFFLHPELFATLSSELRPIIRQELNSVLSLETFTKSQEVRALDDNLKLSYTKTEGGNLALRIDAEDEQISFGYISQGGYDESLDSFFAPCTILTAGIGECPVEDIEKVSMQHTSLGYFGLSNLIEGLTNLKAVLVSEFSRSMGDCRLELIQKLKREQSTHPKILPLDKNFCLQLDLLAVETAPNSYCSFEDVRVVRANGSFGALLFLGSDDVL